MTWSCYAQKRGEVERERCWNGNIRGKELRKRQLVVVEDDLKKIEVEEIRTRIIGDKL